MLSPKMQRGVRINDTQLIMLAERAHYDHSQTGYLHKRTADSTKWKLRWFILYQNMLFYYENESCSRPSGVILLEGCYCDRLIAAKGKDKDKQYCFAITYRRENQRRYEMKAATETACKAWIDAIQEASFNKLLLQKEELEQKHLHLLQIVESERAAKWQYTQQCEDLASEIKKLRAELCSLKKELRPSISRSPFVSKRVVLKRALSQSATTTMMLNESGAGQNSHSNLTPKLQEIEEGSIEIQKIKKVQSFFRGWLCRRRWKQIVDQYIKSPHAESMRKRNSIVFQLVEAEEEYTEQVEILVSCFLRPFKMAASSKKPPCSHEDVNSIFLNSETLLFLHQIFFKGLTSRMESWPTLVLGDLFDMLLPMLSIYQEYVRNHHYSLQVLTECKQMSPSFVILLNRLENKSACHGRSLETFLTYPMHQVSRYILTLHELLAHTPYDHVERKSLQNARQKLEELSRQMHDEVSETENLRKNLAVERMIVEGCDILLDVHQVFVRQGALIQILDKPRGTRGRLSATFGSRNGGDKETLRQCFLFSNHLILTTRQSDDDGRLNLVPQIGKIPLSDAILIEDPNDLGTMDDDEISVCSVSSGNSESSNPGIQGPSRDFKIVFDVKSGVPRMSVHLLAPTIQEKAAWISDISQCMDNVHLNDLLHGSLADASFISMPQSIRNDPKLFKDDVDIRFSRTLNSCKVPQIRYATPERLLQRLTDLRFLSIDFLNTFLLTYRVFTNGVTVLEALKKVFYEAEPPDSQMPSGSLASLDVISEGLDGNQPYLVDRRKSGVSPRRISAASSVSGYGSEVSDTKESKSHISYEYGNHLVINSKSNWRENEDKWDEEQGSSRMIDTPSIVGCSSASPDSKARVLSNQKETEDACHLTIPKVIPASLSSETLTDATVINPPGSPSNLSSVTLIGSAGSTPESKSGSESESDQSLDDVGHYSRMDVNEPDIQSDGNVPSSSIEHLPKSGGGQKPRYSSASIVLGSRHSSISTITGNHWIGRRSLREATGGTSSQQYETQQVSSRAGVVITSSRQSQRRSSTSTAATAFAIATSASSNPPDKPYDYRRDHKIESCREKSRRKESGMSTAATMRVLNVLRHWISKHAQDFELDQKLKNLTIEFLDDIAYTPNLLPAEHKAASQLLRLLTREEHEGNKVDLNKLLPIPSIQSKESIETLSALEIAEQMTYLDHQIFISIASEEFLGQAWMKTDKATRAPHILLMTRRFNEVSQLVVSEIVRRSNLSTRVAVIEKWAAVADISRVLHNYNGVLQICAGFTNTSVYRLKKTWEKVSKTTKQTIDRLQNIVSSDGRFRNLRDALHRCDPPCIPYLGLYLTDFTFIEEGTPNFTEDSLLNFSKMRMIAHVIREIRHFQQTPYKIEMIAKVTNYLLDTSLLLGEQDLYRMSQEIEPRTSRLSTSNIGCLSTTAGPSSMN